MPLLRVLKAFSLADVSILFTLPMLVWGSDASPDTRVVHYLLVFGYSFVVFLNVFTGKDSTIYYHNSYVHTLKDFSRGRINRYCLLYRC